MQAHILRTLDKKIESCGFTVIHSDAHKTTGQVFVMKDLACAFSFIYVFSTYDCSFRFQKPNASDEGDEITLQYANMDNELLTLVDGMCVMANSK